MESASENRSEVDLLILHGAVITMQAEENVLYDGALAVDGGRIVAVGRTDAVTRSYAGRQIINAYDHAVLPGLIDTHHHFLQNFLKGAPDDLAFPDWIAQVSAPRIKMAVDDYLAGHSDLQQQATRLGCIEALKSGITCILNMEWATHPDVIDVYETAGIRAVHTLVLTDVDQWGNPGMLLPMRKAWDLADRLVERCRRSAGERVTFRYGPACENSTSTALLRQVRERANAQSVGIHIHVAESQFSVENIGRLHGKSPVTYLNDIGLLGPDLLGAHCIWLSDRDISLLRETGVSVAYTPECHMKLALGVAPVTKMLSEGIPVALGTDTSAVNDNMDMFEAMRTGVFLQRIGNMDHTAISSYQALWMATMGGATALGLADEIGSLEVGKKADIILVDLKGVHMRPINNIVNNLVYCASAMGDVDTVFVDGRVVVADRRLCCWEEEAVVAEAEAYAMGRFAEAGLAVSPYYERSVGRAPDKAVMGGGESSNRFQSNYSV